MAKRRKQKPVIAAGLYNMVINPASLEKTAAEGELLLSDEQFDAREQAKDFLDFLEGNPTTSDSTPQADEKPEEKRSDSINELFDFFNQ